VLLLVCGLLAAACAQRVAPPLDPATVTWTTYTDEELGFTLRHPDVWRPHRHGSSVLFQDPSLTPMRVSVLPPDEARQRGLWGRSEPMREELRGETRGRLFPYLHFDGPSYVPTLAWVVPHRDAELGIELRTKNQEPDAVQAAILESLVLAPR
jgi:hypothetical protein